MIIQVKNLETLDYSKVDILIRPLVKIMNQFPFIVTNYSCEGNPDYKQAYVLFHTSYEIKLLKLIERILCDTDPSFNIEIQKRYFKRIYTIEWKSSAVYQWELIISGGKNNRKNNIKFIIKELISILQDLLEDFCVQKT